MKTTIDIPDPVLRNAKVAAAREGSTLRSVVTRALETELSRLDGGATAEPKWLRRFGGLRHLRGERDSIDAAISESFGGIDEELWQ